MYWIDVELENTTSFPQTITIPKGTAFEVQNPSLREQSLVAATDIRVSIPSGVHVVKVPAYCMNQDLASPHSAPGRLTLFRMVAPFNSQDDVWDIINNPA